ncbi:MAG: DNA protecting protein DprA [Candidatus Omnitrophica bacterium CG1_02_44_16]|nr:MAG: DNA protecting protein DprA [Candidatus Omnitrophica bacterium CG1_02_44_16]PIY82575.1 MAG: DNA-protecting protein DprA [Candidatus Omnitrophica bacterium CG_4_10_14_0_8_um_filter_44_12]PIZ84075.1 MAG: DNA-protecting protein DprA [Candidatus Omnitrophica bacterium CG_4_10_14_0_2_um_filter_44_9]
MNTLEALVLLNMVEGIGSVRIKKLMAFFKEAPCIFKISAHELAATGILNSVMARKVEDAPRRYSAQQEIKDAAKQGVRIITLFDEGYPKILKEIYDPPFVLYAKGEFIGADANAVGVVGSRGASAYGMSCADIFSSKLSRYGLTIVSGLARGIDTASHRAALNANGRTIAVLGSGLNNIYPPENEGLFAEIAEKGVVVSQFALNTAPLACNFPIRNRIISGLSRGVLVVEASFKSGALITARFALEQGREVFAIPGKVTSETSSGANELIKQGAKMVTRPEEILEDLQFNFTFIHDEPVDKHQAGLNAKELSIAGLLTDEPKGIDFISEQAGLGVADIMSILVQLELKGFVKQLPGKNFIKAS